MGCEMSLPGSRAVVLLRSQMRNRPDRSGCWLDRCATKSVSLSAFVSFGTPAIAGFQCVFHDLKAFFGCRGNIATLNMFWSTKVNRGGQP
jgi:hypothetical protein